MHRVKSEAVTSLHKNIAKVIRAVTEAPLEIISSSHPHGWSQVRADTGIEFELTSISDHQSTVLSEVIDRDLGGRSFVFQLLPQPAEEATFWAGWYNKWIAVGDGTFNLEALSWTFYWGTYFRRRKAILRADWDSLHYRNKRAAQPHWHFDHDLLVEFHRPSIPAHQPSPTNTDELVELPPKEQGLVEITSPSGIQELSMKGMHLAMGGWHHGADHPGCWRVNMPTNWSDVIKWVDLTLRYAREQFDKEFYSGSPIE